MGLEVVDHGIDGMAVSVVRAADEVRFEVNILRDGELRRSLTNSDMQYTEFSEVLFMERCISVRLIVGMIQIILVFECKRGCDAFRDNLHKIIIDIYHHFLAADIDADMMFLAREFCGKVISVLFAVIRDRKRCRHIDMYGDGLIEGLHVLSSGLLDGGCCRVGKRIDVDNIARQLVVVDADFDGMTRQTGIQRTLPDVVQSAK